MNKQNFIVSHLLVVLENISVVVAFCYLAVYFNHWWIALFSILFATTIKFRTSDSSKNEDEVELTNQIRCDFCGEVLYVEDIENAVHREMKNQGWIRAKVGENWKDICPHCKYKMEQLFLKHNESK